MKTVILDTNFLLHCITYKIDFMQELRSILDERFEVAVIDKTLNELEGKKNGTLAKALIRDLNIKLINASKEAKDVDTVLLTLQIPDIIVATQDKALKEKLKKRGIEVITIRQKKYLMRV